MKVVSGLMEERFLVLLKLTLDEKVFLKYWKIHKCCKNSKSGKQWTAPAAELELAVSRNPQNWSFDLEGSEGKININMNLSQASISDHKDQINLHTIKQEYKRLMTKRKKNYISEKFAGSIVISNLEIEGVNNATREPEFYFTMESIDGEGNKIGYHVKLLQRSSNVDVCWRYQKIYQSYK